MSEAAPPEGVTSLYVAFDEDRRGWITLRDWDPDAFENLERFVTFARTECGNLNRFLKAVEGVTGDEGEKVAPRGPGVCDVHVLSGPDGLRSEAPHRPIPIRILVWTPPGFPRVVAIFPFQRRRPGRKGRCTDLLVGLASRHVQLRYSGCGPRVFFMRGRTCSA